MKKKLTKLLMAMLCLVLCLAMFAACDQTDGETQKPEQEDSEPEVEGMAATEWSEKVDAKNFENYTVSMEGRMTVTQNGQEETTADLSQTIKVTSDKVSVTARASVPGQNGETAEFTQTYDGEMAQVYKTQTAQLFLSIIRDYDNFVYDKATNTYKIPETVVVEETLKGTSSTEGMIDVPTRIEIREAVVTFTNDGKLAKLVSDYSQTMTMDGDSITTAGKTTWTFSNFGTTVIE